MLSRLDLKGGRGVEMSIFSCLLKVLLARKI